MDNRDEIEKIYKRQQARFLDHLNATGQLTTDLESDVKRVFGWIFTDVRNAIKQGEDTDDKKPQTD